jgi:lysophospholipase L1-like esterase
MTCVALALALFAPLAVGQDVAGTVFHDEDGDGLQDPGEEGLADIQVRLYGQRDAGGTFDQSSGTDASGGFAFTPGDGCYLLAIEDPPGWRRTLARFDDLPEGSSGYQRPIGLRRFGGTPRLLDRLLDGPVLYSSMGDSIAYNWNNCFDTSDFFYSREVRDRLRCVSPSGDVSLDEAAIKGEHTDDLLVDEGGETNNVFRVIESGAELVTISMIGNDLLNDEPDDGASQDEINRAIAEMLDSRQNLQEALSALVSELPGAVIELNTLYDNLAWNCDSSEFHVEWLPIVNRMLREVAWGQARRVTNAEVFAEFAHQDQALACTGFEDEICRFIGDGIHPRGTGYEIIREKVWESLGGANLGPKDGGNADSITDADHGYLRRIRRLHPTDWQALSGASIVDPEASLDGDDGGAGARVSLGTGGEELRWRGFPDWYDEIVPEKVIVGVRYRTAGEVTDDFYRFEGSYDDQFRAPPGHAYIPTDWNFYTPIVGGGGPDAPDEDPDYPDAELLVVPNVSDYRTVTATLTKNPRLSADGSRYEWPAATLDEIASAQVRLASAPVAGTAGDDYEVVVDAVWLDVYGTEKERPSEVTNLAVEKRGDGGLDLTFDELAGADRYDVYFGRLSTLREEGRYDHGTNPPTGPLCDVATQSAGAGRRQATVAPADVPSVSSYILVTGHVSGVESPTGYRSDGTERDRSQNTCP